MSRLSEEDLIDSVARIKLASADALTAKQVHEALTSEGVVVDFSAVKKAASKAAKRTPAALRLRSTSKAMEPEAKRAKDVVSLSSAAPPKPVEVVPKYEIWRNPKKSINCFGEPFSAWATFLPTKQSWFMVWNEGSPDEGGRRKDKWSPTKPSGFTERHVVTKAMLSLEHGATELGDDDDEIDYHMALNGLIDSVPVEWLKPIDA